MDSSKNPNPLFNKTFIFSLKEAEIRDTSLVIQVMWVEGLKLRHHSASSTFEVYDMGYLSEELVGVIRIYLTHLWMGEQRVGWKKEERKGVEIRPPDGEQSHTMLVLR